MNKALPKDDRLKQAEKRVGPTLSGLLSSLPVHPKKVVLYLRAFKAERELEAWVKEKGKEEWILLKTYPFCSSSGTLGPKRREGDRQIPEGIYYIDRFNPRSKYHLSLGLNYPNAADQILGDPDMPGSDIFIHGGCRTVGCIAITDPGIEEVYLLAEWARTNGQQLIPVHLFPFRYSASNWQQNEALYHQHVFLWRQLEAVYQYFENRHSLPDISIGEEGVYYLKG